MKQQQQQPQNQKNNEKKPQPQKQPWDTPGNEYPHKQGKTAGQVNKASEREPAQNQKNLDRDIDSQTSTADEP